jgi:hypothetical protein
MDEPMPQDFPFNVVIPPAISKGGLDISLPGSFESAGAPAIEYRLLVEAKVGVFRPVAK